MSTSKYEALRAHLAGLPADQPDVTLTFEQIETLIGRKMSPKARRTRIWWAPPEAAKGVGHSQAWLSTGWQVDTVDQREEWVRFRRASAAENGAQAPAIHFVGQEESPWWRPDPWGRRAPEFFVALRGQPVQVVTTAGKAFRGMLIGVDVYDIILRQDSGLELLIVKNNIAYVHRVAGSGA